MGSVDPLQSVPPGPAFHQRYSDPDIIGSGGFGFVVKALRRSDGRPVAVKLIVKSRMARESLVRCPWDAAPDSGLSAWSDGTLVVPREAYVLRLCLHKSVVAFVDLFADQEYFYLAMEHHGTPWESRAGRAPPTPPLTPPTANFPLHPDIRPVYRRSPSRQSLSLTTLDSSSSPSPPVSPTASAVSPTERRGSPPFNGPVPTSIPMTRRSSSSDLFECIEQHNCFAESTARLLFAQVVEAIADLRARGVVHRDIKDENIVVDTEGVVKLIDFGSAILFDPNQPLPLSDRFFGTLSHAPSEVLTGQPFDLFAAESWSLGILLCTLLTGCAPFGSREAAIQGRRSRPTTNVRLTREADDLLDSCFVVDPRHRITLQGILAHPWMRR